MDMADVIITKPGGGTTAEADEGTKRSEGTRGGVAGQTGRLSMEAPFVMREHSNPKSLESGFL